MYKEEINTNYKQQKFVKEQQQDTDSTVKVEPIKRKHTRK